MHSDSSLPSMTGAQAAARALSDARCSVVTHVPGHGASEVYEATQRQRVRATLSYHEEAAYAVAHGAALCGARAAVVIKLHGVLKAANAVQSSLACGVTAGLVCIIADDRAGARSDTIFEAAPLLRGLQLPFREAAADQIHDAVLDAFIDSERTSLPQAVLVDTEALAAVVTRPPAERRLDLPPLYERDAARHIVCPLFTRYQRDLLLARLAGKAADAIARPSLPRVPQDMPEAWQPTLRDYAVFFDALRSVPRDFTSGDATLSSLFGLPPHDAVDAVSYYGGAIPLAVGGWLSGREHVWALSGDFGFTAAGSLGLVEAWHRQAPIKVAIFANGKAQASGGQPVNPDDLERLLGGWETRLHRVDDARDPVAVRGAIDEAMQKDGLRLILLHYT